VRTTDAATEARRASGEESRLRLVHAARDLIAEHGYAGTSIGDICKRAGVAKTAVYWHFQSKEGLLAAVLESLGGEWIEELRKRAYEAADPVARMNRLFDDWREILREQPHLVKLPFFLQLELGGSDSSGMILEALRGVCEKAERAIAEGIEDSLGKGVVEEAPLVAHTTFSLMNGAVSRASIARSDEEVDMIFAELKRTVLVVVLSRIPADLRARLVAEFLPAAPA